MKFLDAHTHLQFLTYEADRGEVLERARAAGVRMITVGTQAATSAIGIKLAEQHPKDIWATVGFHPAHMNMDWHHDKNEQADATPETFDRDRLKELAGHPKVVAIGECGLDYYRVKSDMRHATRERQKEVFMQQIEIAREVGKPLMIHCREAFGDLIEILNSSAEGGSASGGKSYILNSPPGLIHFFTGTKDDAQKLLDMGFAFTFGGVVTFTRDYDEVIKMIPLDRILSETDAPYVAPAPYRGKRNEPCYVVEVVKKLAELKSVSVEKMAEQIMNSARTIFRI